MQPRIDYRKYAQEPLTHMLGLEKYIAESGLEPKLVHLIKMRASQINSCAYCLDMHSIDARAAGESEQRLYTLEAWRETPFFSDRERAALAWTESVTLRSNPRPRRCLRRSAKAFHRKRNRRSDLRSRYHQSLEPPRYLHSHPPRPLQTSQIHNRRLLLNRLVRP